MGLSSKFKTLMGCEILYFQYQNSNKKEANELKKIIKK